MKGLWLALETATPRAAVAIADGGELLAGRLLEHPRQHAEELARAIDETLAEAGAEAAAIAGVVVGRGPGSFVGVRVAIAHAKGLATALSVPLVGLCTLTAVAAGEGEDGEGLAAIDARRGEVYVRRVRRVGGVAEPLGEAEALAPPDAARLAEGVDFVVGNAAGMLGDLAARAEARDGPTLAGLVATARARLATDWRDERLDLVPAYGRAPDARPAAG